MTTVARIGGWRAGMVGVLALAIGLAAGRAAAQCPIAYDSYDEYALSISFASIQVDANGTTNVVFVGGGLATDDFDGDGLTNLQEFEGYTTVINGEACSFSHWTDNQVAGAYSDCGSNLQEPDTDFDGLSDRGEWICSLRECDGIGTGTNPHTRDTDGDNMPDNWEYWVGLDPNDNGEWSGTPTDQSAIADPDGDGIGNLDEYGGPNGTVLPLVPCLAGVISTAPAFNEADADVNHVNDDYTKPLNFDSDYDDLIDSFEYECAHNLEPDQFNDKDADRDEDGLTDFREQCVHPLLAEYWSVGTIVHWIGGAPAVIAGEDVQGPISAPWLGDGEQIKAFVSGYLNLAGVDSVDVIGGTSPQSWPLAVGPVTWGSPLFRSCTDGGSRTWGGIPRWTKPSGGRPIGGGFDTDEDMIADGWEVEHGLNPLSSINDIVYGPSGSFGDPDGDSLVNFQEFFGQDGYRITLASGTGDESNPWITRAINRRYETDYWNYVRAGGPFVTSNLTETLLSVIWAPSAHRAVQSPSDYFTSSALQLSVDYGPTAMPGFFDAASFLTGVLTPVPGVPPFVAINDELAGLQNRFDPFATSQPDQLFVDNDGDGFYTDAVDALFFDADADGIFNAANGDLMLNSAAPPVDDTPGTAITANRSRIWPMPGRDTDDDGIPDGIEFRSPIEFERYPSTPVQSLSPFVRRSARITTTNAVPVQQADTPAQGRYLFTRDWTVESWVYLRGQGTNTYTGAFVQGRVDVGPRRLVPYELGVTNSRPYAAMQTMSGFGYLVSSQRPMPMNKWVHLAISFDHKRNYLGLYIDGLLDQDEQTTEESAASFMALVGYGAPRRGYINLALNRKPAVSFADNLWLDELRMWGVPRSADDIGNNYRRLVNPFQYTGADLFGTNYVNAENTLFNYFPFDDGGIAAEDFTKRAGVSLHGFQYPQDPLTPGGPESFSVYEDDPMDTNDLTRAVFMYGEYLYGDEGFSIFSDSVVGTGRSFVFDANNVSPVIGMVDAEQGAIDSDGDGLPDGWELTHELNPFKGSTPDHPQFPFYDEAWQFAEGLATDPEQDLELGGGDGLDTESEYYSRTNPRKNDTDEDGRYDSYEDFDVDGLPNSVEVGIGSRPDLADTDDDGVEDSIEQGDRTSPIASASPARKRSVFFDGNPGTYLSVPERAAMRLATWTIEASFLPSGLGGLADGEGASVVRRGVQQLTDGLLGANFELRVVRRGTNLYPEARYVAVRENGTGLIKSLIDTNTPLAMDANDADPYADGAFTFLTASFDGVAGVMRLYRNGVQLGQLSTALTRPPITGEGPRSFTRIGDNFRGFVDEVRIWSTVRALSDIKTYMGEILAGDEPSLVALFSIDDGGWPATMVFKGVKSRASAPAVGTAKNDRFLVLPGSVWPDPEDSVHDNEIAQAGVASNAWTYEMPIDGDRVYVENEAAIYEYVASNATWVVSTALDVADPTFVPSVQYAGAPVSKNEGDTWWTGAALVHFESSRTNVTPYAGPVFIEGSMYNGDVADDTFAWFVSRDEYFRRDIALTDKPTAAPGFRRWGPAVDWLADARWVVTDILADTNTLPAEALIGDVYYVESPASFFRYTPTGFEGDPVVDGDRFLVEATGVVYDFDSATTSLVAIADGTTDGGHLYLYVNNLGSALRSEGDSPTSWRRWGFIPTSEDVTQREGWSSQWSQAATRSGGAFFREFGTDLRRLSSIAATGDDDEDDLPNGWEIENGLDPDDPTGTNGPAGDSDGDLLNNLYEYLSGTDPAGALGVDTDQDGLTDYDDDSDGDTLSNGIEQDQYQTDPSRRDTDDDEILDPNELVQGTDPGESRSPYVLRALSFDGRDENNQVVVPERIRGRDTLRLSASTWTVEFMIWPTNRTAAVQPIVSRAGSDSGFLNYEVGLSNGFPYVRFQEIGSGKQVSRQAGVQLPLRKWTHIAGRFSGGVLSLFVDGQVLSAVDVTAECETGPGNLIIGSPVFAGEVRDVRIWKIGRTDQDIRDYRGQSLFYGFRAADAGYLSVSGNGHVKENAVTRTERFIPFLVATGVNTNDNTPIYSLVYSNQTVLIDNLYDQWTLEAWVKVTEGGIVIGRRNVSLTTQADFNYALTITDNGRLRGRFAIEYEDDGGNTQVETEINNIEGEINVADGRWHHVAYTRDDISCSLYVDGYLDVKQPNFLIPLGVDVNNPRIRVLEGPLVIGEGLDGNVDEARVWSRALTGDELRELNTRNLRGNEDGLISYFSFDFQRGITADERASVRDPANEVGLYIGDALLVRDAVNGPPIIIDPVKVYADVALIGYFAADDGGETLEDFIHQMGIVPFSGREYVGDLQPGATFRPLLGDQVPFTVDSDLDGMPDWWESAYGLQPATDVGADGAWGDPDADGLPNLAEFLVQHETGTLSDPLNPDSTGSGHGDFFNWDDTPGLTNRYRIFGEIYTDFDNMEDEWEVDESLDPRAYDSHRDQDQDGWDNLAEFQANIDPSTAEVSRDVLPNDVTSVPHPDVTFSVQYRGFRSTGSLVINAYHVETMDGVPDATFTFTGLAGPHPRVATLTTNTTTVGYLREDSNWFFAFYDLGTPNGTWDPGEPAGYARRQPVKVKFAEVAPVEIDLCESQPNFAQPDYEDPGYGRFAWGAKPNANTYRVSIVNRSVSNSPVVIDRTIRAPRTYFHEQDYRLSGKVGLYQAGYEWFVYHTAGNISQLITNGTFVVSYPASLRAPTAVTQSGTIWNYALNNLQWNQSTGAVAYQVQIARGANFANSVMVTNDTLIGAVPDANGVVTYRLPIRAGDAALTNGTYYWRVRGIAPGQEVAGQTGPQLFSAWSKTTGDSFGIDLKDKASGPFSIKGDLIYFGKVTNGNFIVQAYTSRDYSLEPIAQITITNSAVAGEWPTNRMNYVLSGMPAGTYYIKAYLDQNADRQQAEWESVGTVRANAYLPRPLVLPPSQIEQNILVAFADTDNDRIADDWEWQYRGNLTDIGAGSVRGYTDSNGDGVSDFESYAATPMNVNPIVPYSAGPDGVPMAVKLAFGIAPDEKIYFDVSSMTWDSQGRPVMRWFALPSGNSRGGIGGRATQDSGTAEVLYQVQYSPDGVGAWLDVVSHGKVVYDPASNQFEFVDTYGFDTTGFYRYKVIFNFY